MSDPSVPSSPPVLSQEIHLAECWARLTKALTLYSVDNNRVRLALDVFMNTLEAVRSKEETEKQAGIEVVFFTGGVRIGSQEYPEAQGLNLAWMRDRLEQSALIGVELTPDVKGESLLSFSEQLLRNYTRKEVEVGFAELWPETYEGMRLIDRRFEGVFSGTDDGPEGDRAGHGAVAKNITTSEEEVLVNLLSASDEVTERFETIRGTVLEGELTFDSSDLISRIIKLLPADVFDDFANVLRITTEILDLVIKDSRKTSEPGDIPWLEDDATLSRLMFGASRKLFGSTGPTVGMLSNFVHEQEISISKDSAAKARSGRVGDESITDSLDDFLREYEQLPEGGEDGLQDQADVPGELLGVYLHYLVSLESEDLARTLEVPIARLLESAGEEELRILRSYLLAVPGDKGEGPQYERLTRLVHGHDLTHVVRDCGILDMDWVVRTFPHTFLLYLESLDLSDMNGVRELIQTCSRIGNVRILGARDFLAREGGILNEETAQRLMAHPFRSLIPFVRLILEEGGERFRAPAIEFIKKLSRDAEFCLLEILDPEMLPREYLLAVTDPFETDKSRKYLNEAVPTLLCRFVRGAKGKAEYQARRIEAIRRLAEFPSLKSQDLLDELIHGTRYLFFPAEPRAIREAARKALETMQSESGSTGDV